MKVPGIIQGKCSLKSIWRVSIVQVNPRSRSSYNSWTLPISHRKRVVLSSVSSLDVPSYQTGFFISRSTHWFMFFVPNFLQYKGESYIFRRSHTTKIGLLLFFCRLNVLVLIKTQRGKRFQSFVGLLDLRFLTVRGNGNFSPFLVCDKIENLSYPLSPPGVFRPFIFYWT